MFGPVAAAVCVGSWILGRVVCGILGDILGVNVGNPLCGVSILANTFSGTVGLWEKNFGSFLISWVIVCILNPGLYHGGCPKSYPGVS